MRQTFWIRICGSTARSADLVYDRPCIQRRRLQMSAARPSPKEKRKEAVSHHLASSLLTHSTKTFHGTQERERWNASIQSRPFYTSHTLACSRLFTRTCESILAKWHRGLSVHMQPPAQKPQPKNPCLQKWTAALRRALHGVSHLRDAPPANKCKKNSLPL